MHGPLSPQVGLAAIAPVLYTLTNHVQWDLYSMLERMFKSTFYNAWNRYITS